jgi:2-polyprenyl-3-methyl-5-hydroxy-6-metoxy-1,4-benzoquinol methylase
VSYDAHAAAAFYDEYGEREWTRFEDGRTGLVSFEIHLHYLERFVRPGDRVLDAGGGPGRFTIELARLGADVTVSDVSPGQLELNREHAEAAGVTVRERVVADVCDLSYFGDGSFDAVICYGGPVSYVLERADDAVAELLRVTKPGGYLLLSVMSLVGSFVHALPIVMEQRRHLGPEALEEVLRTGVIGPGLTNGHLTMRLFRSRELRELLARHPCELVVLSASTLSDRTHHDLVLSLDDETRAALVAAEVELAAEPGAVDAGSHLIAVVRRIEPTTEEVRAHGDT